MSSESASVGEAAFAAEAAVAASEAAVATSDAAVCDSSDSAEYIDEQAGEKGANDHLLRP